MGSLRLSYASSPESDLEATPGMLGTSPGSPRLVKCSSDPSIATQGDGSPKLQHPPPYSPPHNHAMQVNRPLVELVNRDSCLKNVSHPVYTWNDWYLDGTFTLVHSSRFRLVHSWSFSGKMSGPTIIQRNKPYSLIFNFFKNSQILRVCLSFSDNIEQSFRHTFTALGMAVNNNNCYYC